MSLESRSAMRDYYDELGADEWLRLTRDLPGRASFEVHRRFLTRFVRPGARVLEVGAGPGRFTQVLAELGARIVVTDFSPVQLDLNRTYIGGTPAESAVESRELLDVCDPSRFADGEFDVVLAYGGPLSYAFERTDEALLGLLRIARPDGVVVASVMSTLGSWRHLLPGAVGVAAEHGEDANDAVLRTGDLRHVGARHVCQMFRAREVEDLVARCGARVLGASASNWASLGDPAALAELEADPVRWERFLANEVAACAEPGALDGGTHLMFAAR
ncbi:class I SAM-dependent methyltransferase [Pengzhenrongella sp.]|uniref:class I SAM-dependent methyltransferase n=1 Tax=Pengzhenrongella sp. TaxID=2888820 RepID=UPI002F95DF49